MTLVSRSPPANQEFKSLIVRPLFKLEVAPAWLPLHFTEYLDAHSQGEAAWWTLVTWQSICWAVSTGRFHNGGRSDPWHKALDNTMFWM
jgi:hypothetical protein